MRLTVQCETKSRYTTLKCAVCKVKVLRRAGEVGQLIRGVTEASQEATFKEATLKEVDFGGSGREIVAEESYRSWLGAVAHACNPSTLGS